MKERPILFSAPMVQAILAGRKTQTRRVVKVTHRTPGLAAALLPPDGMEARPRVAAELCPYGEPGDRLWVRETWAAPHNCDHLKPSEIDGDWRIHYAATEERGGLLWRPSIHMPRWASRITLEVTGVRVERLQDISEADAIAEGIERAGGDSSVTPWRNYLIGKPGEMRLHCSAPSRSYMTLWESINGPGSWEANPWVWAVEFKHIEGAK